MPLHLYVGDDRVYNCPMPLHLYVGDDRVCNCPMPLHLYVGDDHVYRFIHIGFTMVAAAGPFTTSDSLEMGPLRDLLEVVEREKPDALVLVSRGLNFILT